MNYSLEPLVSRSIDELDFFSPFEVLVDDVIEMSERFSDTFDATCVSAFTFRCGATICVFFVGYSALLKYMLVNNNVHISFNIVNVRFCFLFYFFYSC